MKIIFSSFGNDSCALISWAIQNTDDDLLVAYSDTGWAAPWWDERIDEVTSAIKGRCTVHRIPSIGMEQLTRDKKSWPSNQFQFCTLELKIKPTLEWLDAVDPDRTATCMVGILRSESERRKDWPERQISANHGDRDLWAPLINHTTAQRDALLADLGLKPLPHRSMECYPCINANRSDFLLLDEDRIDAIEVMEASMGTTSKGKPRTMYRPNRFNGATGIREVVEWARHGKFIRGQTDMFEGDLIGCDSGMCEL